MEGVSFVKIIWGALKFDKKKINCFVICPKAYKLFIVGREKIIIVL